MRWLLVIACGCTDLPAPIEVTDVRMPVPAADPRFVDLVTPEFTVEPGHELVACLYLDNAHGRFGTDRIEARQGNGGHHIAFRRATERRPAGTFEHCTGDQEALALGDLFLGGGALPVAGWAVEIPADAQLVVETHYLNATDLPLLARDVIRVHRVPDAEVTRWVHAMHLKTYDLDVPPGVSTLAFDCRVPTDLSLFQFWGHQHERGRRVRAELDGAELYDATWGTDPLVWGALDAPLAIAAGSQIRIACTWDNTTGHALRFPDEMCAFGGYVEGSELSCVGDSHTP
ncbi:MAG: hypothetical protein WKG01_26745 [Kofleriaceae bacterium]